MLICLFNLLIVNHLFSAMCPVSPSSVFGMSNSRERLYTERDEPRPELEPLTEQPSYDDLASNLDSWLESSSKYHSCELVDTDDEFFRRDWQIIIQISRVDALLDVIFVRKYKWVFTYSVTTFEFYAKPSFFLAWFRMNYYWFSFTWIGGWSHRTRVSAVNWWILILDIEEEIEKIIIVIDSSLWTVICHFNFCTLSMIGKLVELVKASDFRSGVAGSIFCQLLH